MSGIGKLMRRLGYVKLDQYGLLVTAEDRILATRTAILDDGLGGRVVGWRDGDLAAMELGAWAPATPRTPAPRVVAPPPLPPVSYVPPLPIVPIIPPVAATPIKAAPVAVAAEPELTEDEWEWEIAVARARAVAEEVELAKRVVPIAQARKPKFVAQEPKTLPGVAPFDDATTQVGDDTQVTAAKAPERKTIIPVPQLGRSPGRPIEPMVRRAAKGTSSPATGSVKSEQTSPMIELRDETVPNLRIAPAPAPTPLPSIKQRMANR